MKRRLDRIRKTYQYLKLLEEAQVIDYCKRYGYNGVDVYSVKGPEFFDKKRLDKRIAIVRNNLRKMLKGDK